MAIVKKSVLKMARKLDSLEVQDCDDRNDHDDIPLDNHL